MTKAHTTLAAVIWTTLATVSSGAILMESFEPPFAPRWTVVDGSANFVTITNPLLAGSNFDGVDESNFLLFGMGDDPGHIYFTLETVPGQDYLLSYLYSATDSWTLPRHLLNVGFTSRVVSFHGMKTVLQHGMEKLVEDLEPLDSREHTVTVPGEANWRISEWYAVDYSFRATSTTTRVYFDTVSTTAPASVGVLDKVTVTSVPEPSTALLLLATGSVWLAAKRRTRRL